MAKVTKEVLEARKEMSGARAFITIPASLSMDEDLLKKPKSIILLGHIVSMLNVTQTFYMSNSALAKRLNCTPRSIVDYLTLLERKQIILREKIYDSETHALIGRQISAGPKLIESFSKSWSDALMGQDFPTPREADFPTPREADFPTPREADFLQIEHNNRSIDDEEETINQIISRFEEAGKPLAYSGNTKLNQIVKLKKLIRKTNSDDLEKIVSLIIDTKIKTDALNYLIVALKELKKQRTSTTKYRYGRSKRVEQGTDWKKKIAEDRAKKTEVDVDLQAIMKNLAQFDPKE